MALGSHIEMTGRVGCRGALQASLALLLASSAQIFDSRSSFCSTAPLGRLLRIAVADSSSELLVRLTDVPDHHGGYRVEFIRAPDLEDMLGGWKPLSPTGFHSSMGDGIESWRADLREQHGAFVGESMQFDDRWRDGSEISAMRISCRHAK